VQNAEVVKDAEKYYRTSALGRADSWNVRDSHMVKAINDIIGHRTKQTGRQAKAGQPTSHRSPSLPHAFVIIK